MPEAEPLNPPERVLTSGSRRGAAGTRTATAAHSLLLAGAAGGIFFGAAAPQGTLGLFLLCAGMALLICPPQARVGWGLWLAAAGFVGGGALALLPACWFAPVPWRVALAAVPGVALPGTVSVAPRETLFWLAVLALAALTGLCLLTQPLRSRALLALAGAAVAVCGVYAGLAIYAKTTGWHPALPGGADFGFFPNHNHTATLLFTGGVAALGVLRIALRDRHAWVGLGAAAGLALCVVALCFFSASRGGVVFLLAGTLLWLAGLGRGHRSLPLAVSAAALLLAVGAWFLASESQARTRLLALAAPPPAVAPAATPGMAQTPPPPDPPLDLRVLIYRDTLALVRAFPLTGTGLGTFPQVFPQYRDASRSDFAAVHPESDWLMAAAESGVPAALCLLALCWGLARRLPGLRHHPAWPLRWACAAAAAAAALHGLVDVPAHHVPLGCWLLVSAGLALQPGQAGEDSGSFLLPRAVFGLGGVGALALGTLLVRAEWFSGPPLPPFAAARAQADVLRAFERHDPERAIELVRQALRVSPIQAPLYFQLGALLIPYAGTEGEVDAAFAAQRLLNPAWSALPFQQGEAWINYDSGRTASLWLDALARLQRNQRANPAAGADYYHEMMVRATVWPDVQQGLLPAAAQGPAYALVWLESARAELAAAQFDGFARDERFLDQLDSGQRRQFLRAWDRQGDPGSLARFIADRPAWEAESWPITLRHHLAKGEWEQAVRDASRRCGVSLAWPPSIPENAPGGAPAPAPEGSAAEFYALWQAGNTVAARRVLAEASSDGKTPADPEMWRLRAAEATQQGDWPQAWRNLRQYLQQTGSTDLP